MQKWRYFWFWGRFLMWAHKQNWFKVSCLRWQILFVHQTESHYAPHTLQFCCSLSNQIHSMVHWIRRKKNRIWISNQAFFMPSIKMIRKSCRAGQIRLRRTLFLAKTLLFILILSKIVINYDENIFSLLKAKCEIDSWRSKEIDCDMKHGENWFLL